MLQYWEINKLCAEQLKTNLGKNFLEKHTLEKYTLIKNYFHFYYYIQLITCEILAAERLRLMAFHNRLIIDRFANVVNILIWQFSTNDRFKHRKNCECCHHHSLFKGLNVIVHIVVLNCQKCNQCLKCHVSGHKIFQKI